MYVHMLRNPRKRIIRIRGREAAEHENKALDENKASHENDENKALDENKASHENNNRTRIKSGMRAS